MTLASQATAAVDAGFTAKVEAAIVGAAVNIYNEASTLAANLAAGVPVTAIPITLALGAALAAGTVILVGGESVIVGAAGAPIGATSIPTTWTPPAAHHAGEPISPPTVPGHGGRAGLAAAVLRNPSGFAVDFAWALASQGLDNTSTDTAISNMVAAVWNPMAGA